MNSPDKNILKNMRQNTLLFLGALSLLFWLGITYFIFLQKPSMQTTEMIKEQKDLNRNLELKLENLERKVREQKQENSLLLNKLKSLKSKKPGQVLNINKLIDLLENPNMDYKEVLENGSPKSSENGEEILEDKLESHNQDENNGADYGDNKKMDTVENEDPLLSADSGEIDAPENFNFPEKPVIPVLLFSCNRVSVNRALDLLLAHRPNKELYPIIVSQDCGHAETREVIETYGDQIIYIQQPDLSEPNVPAKEKKFKGYFKIARHYGWALNHTFMELGFDQVVIVEDDLEIAPDFFEYFTATLPVLREDDSLWCVSAWNDNGKTGLINESQPQLLYRTDFFPGLGWMLTKKLWTELMVKWPRSYWDDWMREPQQRKGRSCIRPEISRTKTFGKIGVSNGLFFEKHLKYIVLNSNFVPFTVLDLNFLKKTQYDESFVKTVYDTPVVNLSDLKNDKVGKHKAVRLVYHTRDAYKKSAKALGIMDDFKSGVPRMAYRGIVTFQHKGVTVFLAPNINWTGYDPKWA